MKYLLLFAMVVLGFMVFVCNFVRAEGVIDDKTIDEIKAKIPIDAQINFSHDNSSSGFLKCYTLVHDYSSKMGTYYDFEIGDKFTEPLVLADDVITIIVYVVVSEDNFDSVDDLTLSMIGGGVREVRSDKIKFDDDSDLPDNQKIGSFSFDLEGCSAGTYSLVLSDNNENLWFYCNYRDEGKVKSIGMNPCFVVVEKK